MIIRSIEQGDLVDFGPMGEFYVTNLGYNEHEYWVTRTEADRFRRHSEGWVIKKNLARRIVEKAWEANMEPEMITMYESNIYNFFGVDYNLQGFRTPEEVEEAKWFIASMSWNQRDYRETIRGLEKLRIDVQQAGYVSRYNVNTMNHPITEQFSTDRYFPPNMREGGEEAYKRKGYPKVKVERVGHVNHLWTKKVNRKFEWKGEWVCSICGATVRSRSAPLPDAQVDQLGSPSINTLLPISGKTVVEDIKKLESRVEKMARTVIEAERALQANGFTIINQHPGPNGMTYELHRELAFSEDYIRGVLDPIKIFQLTVDPNGHRATVEIENRPWVTGLESKVIKMAEQTDFVAGTAIMMGIGWSPAPGNRKDFEDGVSRVYEYTGTDDPMPPYEMSFSSFTGYDEWQNHQKAKIESALSVIEAWIHGFPVSGRVEIWYPNKMEQMEKVNTHVNDVNTGQKENILQRVSRTGHALFEDGEKCPKCGSTKIETAGDSINCQMCGDSYKKKKND